MVITVPKTCEKLTIFSMALDVVASYATSKGGSRRREKVKMLIMMRAFAPSAATVSDATTTSGLGSGLSSVGQ